MTRLKWATTSATLAAMALVVWFGTQIGPVLLVLSDRYDQGLHLGDLLVGAPLALAALVTAVAGLTASPRSR